MYKIHSNGLVLLEVIVVLLMSILDLVELKSEEPLEEKKKLEVVEKVDLMLGNNI